MNNGKKIGIDETVQSEMAYIVMKFATICHYEIFQSRLIGFFLTWQNQAYVEKLLMRWHQDNLRVWFNKLYNTLFVSYHPPSILSCIHS